MKKTIYKIFMIITIIATSITMTACSNPIKEDNLNLSEEVDRVVQENQQLKEEILQLQQNNQKLDEEIAKLDSAKGEKDPEPVEEKDEQESIFTIYGANIDTYERELISEMSIKDSLPLEEKLEIIAATLSKITFGGSGIEVVKMEDEAGKKIAVVNLTEKTTENDVGWSTGYFQGSTGGTITAVSLEETFLQKEYKGEWIDGVRFLYEGEKIEFDHVEPIREVIYR